MFSWKIALITLFLLFGNKGNVYSETMVVVQVSDEWVTCVDFNGNEWAFENSAGDWFEGDFASCVMYDNGTDIIYDDEILSASYCGWCQGAWGYDSESGLPIVEFDY